MADNFDNYGMKVRATVDMPTVGDIDKQIRKLEKSISKLQVSGQFNDTALKNLTNQLNALKATVTTANFSLTALSELTTQVEKALGNIQISGSFLKVGQEVGSAITQGAKQNIDADIVSEMKKISDSSISTMIQNENKKQKEISETLSQYQNLFTLLSKLQEIQKRESSYPTTKFGNVDIWKRNKIFVPDEYKSAEVSARNVKDVYSEYTKSISKGKSNEVQQATFNQFGKFVEEYFREYGQYSKDTLKSVLPKKMHSLVDEIADDVFTLNDRRNLYKTENIERYGNDMLSSIYSDIKSQIVALGKNINLREIVDSDGFFDDVTKTLSASDDLEKIIPELDRKHQTTQWENFDDILTQVCNTLGVEIPKAESTLESQSTSTTNTIVQNEEKKQQAIQETARLTESLNDEDNSDRIKELAVEKSKARDEINELRKEIEDETGVKVSVSDIKQAQKEIEQANKVQQEGTRENIKLRAKQLANARMVLKEEKLRTDQENEANRRSLLQTKVKNKEAIEGLKQQRLLLQENRKLEDEKSKKSVNAKKEENIKFQLDNGHGVSQYQNRIQSLINDFERYGIATDKAQQETSQLNSILSKMRTASGQELITLADKLETEFKAVKVSVDSAKLSYDKFLQPVSSEKASSLIVRINDFLTKNTAITKEAKEELQGFIRLLQSGNVNLNDWNKFNTRLKEINQEMRVSGKLGKSLKQTLIDGAKSFAQWTTASGAVMEVVTALRKAVTELKEVDTLLTEISKANDSLTPSQLLDIGNSSFDVASKYGKKATDYLSGVQEASRAGYDNAEEIAELSTAIQGAGDVTAETANSYVIATDKAYKLGGSVEALTKIFDGSNKITNENAVTMTDLAEGMSIVGSTAASFGIEANKTTSAIATMSAATQQSGSEIARAFRAILLNIRQVSDEEENIDAEGLTKYEKACNALGVSLKETKNGVLSLRDPMKVLEDLSKVYNELDESDIRRTNLLSSVGGKLRSTALDALLRQWDMYETMLRQYEDGTGSMVREAEKTASSLEGSLNRISNTWTDTIENILSSEFLTKSVNFFNFLLTGVNKLTDALGTLGTIGLGAGLFAGFKNIGRPKMFGLCFEICR